MSESKRTIKKYPNRRLYDTEISSYITLEEVRQLVLDGETFEVRDARSGKDLTRSVLLQIIAEHEEHGQPMLSTQLLTGIIGFYGDNLQGFLGPYLEQSMGVFLDQSPTLRKDLVAAREAAPGTSLDAFLERNREVCRHMQEALREASASAPAAVRGGPAGHSR
jgi:polyhydroxyalkanoate synthesis repressor PhaR